ncbi:hypothetical protein SAMN04488112_10270 [Melghirimyces thermohalophilus]|uniref:Uncharacterized protein n=1 Tax=Melghirimyces thermohalophilus TaxID=1236220 RepID=A0A1G6I5N1_9BACL|nr:hypothetical protein SAMN04488112_10270 [Melghirimyces thermohalophilus]
MQRAPRGSFFMEVQGNQHRRRSLIEKATFKTDPKWILIPNNGVEKETFFNKEEDG